MYGQMFAIHYGANAFRKNPSADKVFVIDGDAGDIADQTPILKSTVESVSLAAVWSENAHLSNRITLILRVWLLQAEQRTGEQTSSTPL